MSIYHVPVLLQSVGTLLDIRPQNKYLDATIGGGGHTKKILEYGGLVLGMDQDPDALAACGTDEALKPALASSRLILVRSNFIHLDEVIARYHWSPLMGVIMDLGVSWHQLKTPQRGFSFQNVGPLDMRMDPDLPNTAATLVNILTINQLIQLFRQFGQEPKSAQIAEKIIRFRPFKSTDELSRIIPEVQSRRRVFQALRIAVNDELTALSVALPKAFRALAPTGHLAVISFHSLEDKIVKSYFSSLVVSGQAQELTASPVVPGQTEIEANPHSRSAKLRVIKKI